MELTAEQLGTWTASVANYAYWWKRLKQDRDPTKILGQDNFFRYVPRKRVVLRLTENTAPLDGLRAAAAALTIGADIEISWHLGKREEDLPWPELIPVLKAVEESDSQFFERVRQGKMDRVRLVERASKSLHFAAAESGVLIIDDAVLANGRLELLHYLQESSVSIDYHRYGNLGLREGELRKPVL